MKYFTALAALLALGCTKDLDIDSRLFPCAGDTDCANGKVCNLEHHVCVNPGEQPIFPIGTDLPPKPDDGDGKTDTPASDVVDDIPLEDVEDIEDADDTTGTVDTGDIQDVGPDAPDAPDAPDVPDTPDVPPPLCADDQCEIDGECYDDGDSAADSAGCKVCNTSILSDAWTIMPTNHSCSTTACTEGQKCDEDGACTGGTPISCADDNPCTDNPECDAEKGCAPVNNTAACDDGDKCTAGGVCSEGECQKGAALECDDDNDCTTNGCKQSVGCEYVPNTNACDDSNPCTENDTCAATYCDGDIVVCNDGHTCTTDTCEESTGCVFTPTETGCDDSNPCTDDTCTLDGCAHTNNDAPCDDKNECTVPDTCSDGGCVTETITCDDGNGCTSDTCDPLEPGGCVFTVNTAPCDDGDKCTTVDTCAAKECVGAVPLTCVDGHQCTVDDCDKTSGCVYTVTPDSCGDGNPCTDDACTLDGCAYTANTASCTDNDACTEGDVCADKACVPGAAITCEDNNACTQNSCDAATGCNYDTPTVCEDGVDCTTNLCDTVTGCVFEADAGKCADGNECTDDICDGACFNPPATGSCEDDDPCTIDTVCSGTNCVGGPKCDDADVCTVDSCGGSGTCYNTPFCTEPEKPACSAVFSTCFTCEDTLLDFESGFWNPDANKCTGHKTKSTHHQAVLQAQGGSKLWGCAHADGTKYLGIGKADEGGVKFSFPDAIEMVAFDFRSYLNFKGSNAMNFEVVTEAENVAFSLTKNQTLQFFEHTFLEPVTTFTIVWVSGTAPEGINVGIDTMTYFPVGCQPPDP